MQNKLHFAITGNTAAEIIAARVNIRKTTYGANYLAQSTSRQDFLSDASVAKNYLTKDELSHLNRIVNMYIDYAEFQAVRGKTMAMKEWSEKLEAFLKFHEQDILIDFGRISHEVAKVLAEKRIRKISSKARYI